jgi:hypothetical protein
VNFIVQSGAKAASSIKHAAGGVDFVITMLPVGALAQQAAVSAYARPACQSVECACGCGAWPWLSSSERPAVPVNSRLAICPPSGAHFTVSTKLTLGVQFCMPNGGALPNVP